MRLGWICLCINYTNQSPSRGRRYTQVGLLFCFVLLVFCLFVCLFFIFCFCFILLEKQACGSHIQMWAPGGSCAKVPGDNTARGRHHCRANSSPAVQLVTVFTLVMWDFSPLQMTIPWKHHLKCKTNGMRQKLTQNNGNCMLVVWSILHTDICYKRKAV